MTWNILEISILSVLTICFIAQMLFYWIVLAKPCYSMRGIVEEKPASLTESPPVSIIISINKSNPGPSLFLTHILEQDYPEFEVIAITDEISDADEEDLIRLKNRYPHLYVTHVPEETKNISRKKLAITLGIKAAKYDKLLFTEQDSYSRTKDWIYLMARHFSEKKTIVLGFSAFENTNNLWRKYAAYEYFFSNLQMISLALFNHPYAGNGRNMAYEKSHFIEQKGFAKYRSLQQGEDDLFVNEIASGKNTDVELSASSVVIVKMPDFRDWKRQKINRTYSKRFYKRGPVAFWRMEAGLRIGFVVAVISCFIFRLPYTVWGIASACFIIRLLSQILIMNKTAKNLQVGKFYLTIPVFDLLQPFINLYFFVYSLLKGKENYTYRYEKR